MAVVLLEKGWLLLAKAMVWLLSWLPFAPLSNENEELFPPMNFPDFEDLEQNPTVDRPFPTFFFQLLGYLLLALIAFLLIRSLFRAFRRNMHIQSPSENETRSFVRREEIKKKRRRFRSLRKQAPKSSIRRKYKKAAEALIAQDYAYPASMTPLEFLAELPETAVKESNFAELTEQYLSARYERDEP